MLVAALGVGLFVLQFRGVLRLRFGRSVAGIAAEDPPSQPDDSERGDEESDAQTESRADPFTGE